MSQELLDEIDDFLQAKSGTRKAGDLLISAARRIEALQEAHDTELADDIHVLLDLVERPTGTLHAAVPPSPAAERALIKLYDAVGRKL